jgi:hypothetical protein
MEETMKKNDKTKEVMTQPNLFGEKDKALNDLSYEATVLAEEIRATEDLIEKKKIVIKALQGRMDGIKAAIKFLQKIPGEKRENKAR